ncbi:MAG TPA: hypothetical protein VM370_07255 [Candidatus Thermoplasmatota archaeon]|nr:hypothetical protein [Candidatus Thermoplasmatota archaeon]
MARVTAVTPASELPGPLALQRTVMVARAEPALEEPQIRRFVNLSITRLDKEATDTVQAWFSFREGRRVPLWELYNLILAEALENREGRFYRMGSRSWV